MPWRTSATDVFQEHKFFSLRQKDHDPRFTNTSITLSKILFHMFCFFLKTWNKKNLTSSTLFQIVCFFLTTTSHIARTVSEPACLILEGILGEISCIEQHDPIVNQIQEHKLKFKI